MAKSIKELAEEASRSAVPSTPPAAPPRDPECVRDELLMIAARVAGPIAGRNSQIPPKAVAGQAVAIARELLVMLPKP